MFYAKRRKSVVVFALPALPSVMMMMMWQTLILSHPQPGHSMYR